MPNHWTYDKVGAELDLSQGDYLAPTSELREVLKQVHPHFCDPKYVGFVIATQTCDLVRREGAECAARYISVAAVRTLYAVLPRLVSSIDGALVKDNIFFKSRRSKAQELLGRVLDQNEQALGLFYFHADSEIGIGDPSVAYLRVTVALKSDHYATLLAARRGRLKPEFQAKFGWLIGNLYARPATTDWAEQNAAVEKNEVIQRLLQNARWVDDKALEMVGAVRDYKSLSPEDLLTEVRRQRPPRLIDNVVEVAAEVAARHIVATVTARLQTFDHHLAKLARPPKMPEEGLPLDDQAPPRLEPEVREQILARARESLCADLTEKESTQLKTTLKSEARLKQLLPVKS